MASLIRSLMISAAVCGSVLGMAPKRPDVTPFPGFDREVPVLLYSGIKAEIDVNGSAALECYRGIKLSQVYYFTSPIYLKYEENGIKVLDENGPLTAGLTEVRCKPRDELTAIGFGGKIYRGYIKGLYRSGGLMVINAVDMEDYLAGVLPGEIGERTEDEYEAAKAQAVAARTYAVWKLTEENPQGMLFPTIADQLYLGKNSEMPLLTRAVNETAGEILIFNGRPVAAYYHAVCGGRTQPVRRAWPEKTARPYLTGIDDHNYCAWAKNYFWTEYFRTDILTKNLEKYFVSKNLVAAGDFGKITDIDFSIDEETGRVRWMHVITDTLIYTVEGDQIRWALGKPSSPGAILPSTYFRAEKSRSETGEISIAVSGRGNGHGVGLCQCGAIGRARAGQKYDRILKTYYEDARIERIY